MDARDDNAENDAERPVDAAAVAAAGEGEWAVRRRCGVAATTTPSCDGDGNEVRRTTTANDETRDGCRDGDSARPRCHKCDRRCCHADSAAQYPAQIGWCA